MKQAILMQKFNGLVIKATYAKVNVPELSYKSNCLHCKNDFLHSRITAKFCSEKCRKKQFTKEKLIREAIQNKRDFERRRLIEKQLEEQRKSEETITKIIQLGNRLEKDFKYIDLINQHKK